MLPSSLSPVIAAALGANAYVAPEEHAAAAVPAGIDTEIRGARVELYCGHDALAIACVRLAAAHLQTGAFTPPAEALAALDRACWHIRRHEHSQAEEALEAAQALVHRSLA